MSDELDRLRAALRAHAPQPPPGVSEGARAAALAAFDEQRQGIGDRPRQTGRVAIDATTPLRRFAMWLSRPYPAFAGVAVVLAVVAIVSYQTLVVREAADPTVPAPPTPPAEAETVTEAVGQAPEPLIVTLDDGRIAKAVPDSLGGEVRVEASIEAVAEAAVAERTQAAREVRSLAATVELEADDFSSLLYRDWGRDEFEAFDPNPVKMIAEEPVSTFSIDVDTASYAFMRAALNRGVLPQPDAVRVEEFVNYFPYDYAPPESL